MLSLNDREWKEFLFPKVFKICGGFYNKKPEDSAQGSIPFIGATYANNGITQFCTVEDIEKTSKTGDNNNAPIDKKIFPGNCIAVTNNGSVGYAYYQKHPFTCSHDVNPLYLLDRELNEPIAKFLISAIEKQRICFTYVHKWRPTRMRKSKIMLPVNPKGQPDYDFMEAYVKERERIKAERYTQYCKERFSELGGFVDIETLSSKSWDSFFIKKIFDEIERGKRLKKDDHISGDKPYVSSTSLNNGVDRFIGNESKTRVFEDCLSLANSGSVGSCFYEPFQYVASDHVTHLKKYDTSKYIYLFMATMLNRLSEKYNFNREINDSRISREKILLPITEEGEPDYDYMEQYAKNMMIRKYQQYLDYIEK